MCRVWPGSDPVSFFFLHLKERSVGLLWYPKEGQFLMKATTSFLLHQELDGGWRPNIKVSSCPSPMFFCLFYTKVMFDSARFEILSVKNQLACRVFHNAQCAVHTKHCKINREIFVWCFFFFVIFKCVDCKSKSECLKKSLAGFLFKHVTLMQRRIVVSITEADDQSVNRLLAVIAILISAMVPILIWVRP